MIVKLHNDSTKPRLYWLENIKTKQCSAPLYQSELSDTFELLESIGVKIIKGDVK